MLIKIFRLDKHARKPNIRFLIIYTYTGDLKTSKIHENSLFL